MRKRRAGARIERQTESLVALLSVPRRLARVQPDALDERVGNRQRRGVGVRVHAVGAGQDALEAVRAVAERLPRLGGHTGERVARADQDLARGGRHVGVESPHDNDGIALLRADLLPDRAPVLRIEPVVADVGVDHEGPVLGTGDDADAVGELAREA